jgi:hypothetical protein
MICGKKLKATLLLSLLVLLPSLVFSQQSWQAEKKEMLELIADLNNENELLIAQLQTKDRQLQEKDQQLNQILIESKELKISLEAQKLENENKEKENKNLSILWNEEKDSTIELRKSLANMKTEAQIAWSSAAVSALAFIVTLLVK